MWPALVVAVIGVLCLVAYCLLYRHLPTRRRMPRNLQILAWLGIVMALGGALCFAMAAFFTER